MRPFFQFLILAVLVLAGVSVLVRNSGQVGELQTLQGGPAAETVTVVDPNATPTHTPTPEPNGIDTIPPEILSIEIVPGKVDTVAQYQVITLTLHITDDLSGFGWAKLRFVPASGGTQYVDAAVGLGDRISGDRRDGIYVVSAGVPKYSAYGRWYLSRLFVADNANNSYELGSLEYGVPPQDAPSTEPSPASLKEPVYFVNGEYSGEIVLPQPETVEPLPGPLPPEDGVSADATPWAGDMFLPSLGQ